MRAPEDWEPLVPKRQWWWWMIELGFLALVVASTIYFCFFY